MNNIKTDRLIWDSFRHGDQSSLEWIYEENNSALFYYGLKFLNDENLVKDMIQELFIELIDSGARLSKTDNIRFYLLKAFRNKLFKVLVKRTRFQQEQLFGHDFSLQESVEQQLIKREVETEMKEQVLASVRKLSAKQQEIIYLRFYNNISYQDIAEIFQTKVQTVRNLMNRAMTSLKEDMIQTGMSRRTILFVLSLPI